MPKVRAVAIFWSFQVRPLKFHVVNAEKYTIPVVYVYPLFFVNRNLSQFDHIAPK